MIYVNTKVHQLLQECKYEAHITHLCLFSGTNGKLTIYTDCPGRLIGLGGNLFAKYKDKISKASRGTIQNIEIIETQGIF